MNRTHWITIALLTLMPQIEALAQGAGTSGGNNKKKTYDCALEATSPGFGYFYELYEGDVVIALKKHCTFTTDQAECVETMGNNLGLSPQIIHFCTLRQRMPDQIR